MFITISRNIVKFAVWRNGFSGNSFAMQYDGGFTSAKSVIRYFAIVLDAKIHIDVIGCLCVYVFLRPRRALLLPQPPKSTFRCRWRKALVNDALCHVSHLRLRVCVCVSIVRQRLAQKHVKMLRVDTYWHVLQFKYVVWHLWVGASIQN